MLVVFPQTNNKFTCREVQQDIKINEAQIKNVFPKGARSERKLSQPGTNSSFTPIIVRLKEISKSFSFMGENSDAEKNHKA